MAARRRIAKAALPLGVLAIAAIVTVTLIASRPTPERGEPRREGPLVEVVAVRRGAHPIEVIGHGNVVAAREVEVVPQISGVIVWMSAKLVPGGIMRRDEVMFRIDPRDYRLELEQSLAQLAEAESQLALEQGRHRVAGVEWEEYARDVAESEVDIASESLVRREPQLEAAEVHVRSSRATVAKNRVALSRTEVRAPFDAFVDEESLDLGQMVSPQASVARLVGVERFWVRAVIPVDALARIRVPDVEGEAGSSVRVRQLTGDEIVEREGRVARLLGRLDAQSRLARILVVIDDPFGLETEQTRGLPLLVDAYVEVAVEGEPMEDVIRVPREALHQRDTVYVFAGGALDIRPVSVVWRAQDSVLVGAGLEDGERVVVSGLAQPVDGMPLRAATRGSLSGDERPP